MRKFLLLATVALGIVAATASTAQARGYTCSYKAKLGIYVVVDGYDNEPYLCRALNSGMHGRRVYWAPGHTYCAWATDLADVRVSVRARSRLIGRAFCALMAGRVPSQFYRIR
jgi:hypothetical protein